MAWHNLFNNIATLASIEYQEKYVIGGTVQEFLSIDDLVHDFLASAEWAKHPENSDKFAHSHLEAIDDLYNFIGSAGHEALNAKSHAEVGPLMRDHDVWNEIRRRAAATLNLLGISIAHVPAEELDEYEFDYCQN